MFIRYLSFVAILGVLFLNEGYANPPGNDEESPQTNKRGRDDDRKNKENKTPLKKEKIDIQPSPFSQYSPETAERKFFSPIRRTLAVEEYKNGKKKSAVDSDFVRKIYSRELMETFFECVEIEGKVVYQRDKLFDPYAKVLSKKGVWETNFQRMERGLCPVGYKGIANENDLLTLNQKEIRKQQKLYRIELQHITQKDTGTDLDPICEMTHSAHMGKN